MSLPPRDTATDSGRVASTQSATPGGPLERSKGPDDSLASEPLFRWNRIAGFTPLYFAAFAVIVGAAGYANKLPDSMFAGFAITIVMGGVVMWLGNLIPVVRDFGLPTILCIFLPAIFVVVGWLPESMVAIVQNFLGGYSFLDFFVITVITGSILGMPRALLLKAGPRFAAPVLGGLLGAFLIVGAVGALIGFGFLETLLFVVAPIMAGGIGIGAIPMSEIYAANLGGDPADFLGQLMSAVFLANLLCIVFAGVYSGLGRRRKQLFVGFDGHGQLMQLAGDQKELQLPPRRLSASFVALGKGLTIAAVLYAFGQLLGGFAGFLHPYAWTIIAAVAIKLLRLFPKELEEAGTDWSGLISSFLTPALLVGVSLTYIDINEVLVALSNPVFIPLIALTVICAALCAGVVGWLVKLNFVESSITAGLVMADTGGSGDVSVLSAAGRMHLMPFAALTTRFGGALVLFVTSILASFL